MKRNLWLGVLMALMTVSAYGQDRSLWRSAADIRDGARGSIIGTVVDVDEARRQLTLTADNDNTQRITVVTDAVSTQYNGFGGIVNDAPEVFRGSRGFSTVTIGDRIDIRGTGRGTARVAAEQITLLGRSTVASSTSTSSSATVAEGTIRQINLRDGRLVIQADRRMITVRTMANTPVYYRGQTYQVANLEVGDRIRIDYEPRSAAADDITARSIEVTQSVQDGGTLPADRVTSVAGKVTRVDRGADTIRVDTGRTDVTVDVARSADSSGRRMRASDFKVGDQVDITGSYSSASNVFVASTIRMDDDVFATPRSDDDDDEDRGELGDYVVVTISGTVTESLQTSPTLVIRERTTSRTLNIFVTEDFIYRNRSGNYAAAEKLVNGDAVLIKAYRDEDGNLIAQTIRIR